VTRESQKKDHQKGYGEKASWLSLNKCEIITSIHPKNRDELENTRKYHLKKCGYRYPFKNST